MRRFYQSLADGILVNVVSDSEFVSGDQIRVLRPFDRKVVSLGSVHFIGEGLIHLIVDACGDFKTTLKARQVPAGYRLVIVEEFHDDLKEGLPERIKNRLNFFLVYPTLFVKRQRKQLVGYLFVFEFVAIELIRVNRKP